MGEPSQPNVRIFEQSEIVDGYSPEDETLEMEVRSIIDALDNIEDDSIWQKQYDERTAFLRQLQQKHPQGSDTEAKLCRLYHVLSGSSVRPTLFDLPGEDSITLFMRLQKQKYLPS